MVKITKTKLLDGPIYSIGIVYYLI